MATTFLALLRGVNVGQNALRMERLRELCAEMGFREARTYLQSGNLILQARGTAAELSKALEKKLAGETRLPVTVIVRRVEEIRGVLTANPLLGQRGIDPSKLHVTFLREAPEKSPVEALRKIAAGADEFRWAGTEIYLHCPAGYGETKLSNAALERILGMRATTRNWRTVTKLCDLCSG